ncbi:MAG: hypothetical protein RSB82_04360 [Victivallaceae bacterium]
MKKFTYLLLLLSAIKPISSYASLNPSDTLNLNRSIYVNSSLTENPYGESTKWFETINYRLGFHGDYVFDRKMISAASQATETGLWNPAYHKDVIKFSLNTNSCHFVLNVRKHFDLFFNLGASKFNLKGTSDLFNLSGTFDNKQVFVNNGTAELETKSGCHKTVGLRYAKHICHTIVGLSFAYNHSKPRIHRIGMNTGSTQFNLEEFKKTYLDYKEWSFGFALSENIGCLSPYLGITCSKAMVDMNKKTFYPSLTMPNPLLGPSPTATAQLTNVSLKLNSLKNRFSFGTTVGCGLYANSLVSVNVEAALINKHSVKASGLIRF